MSSMVTLRKPQSIFLVIIALLLFFGLRYRTRDNGPSWLNGLQLTAADAATSTFTRAQCDAAFAPLFKPIGDAVHKRGKKLVQSSDLDIPPGRCMFRALIYERELYVIDSGDPQNCYIPTWRERVVGTLASIHRALVTSQEGVPNIEFAVSYDDKPRRSRSHGAIWALTRHIEDSEDIWLMPDYGYWSWGSVGLPSYAIIRRKIDVVNQRQPWEKKIKKAVWRGNVKSEPTLREKLIEASEGKEWSDIRHAHYLDSNNASFIPMEGLCNYMFVMQTEGTSYSGRLKYLLLCDSVTVAHKLYWEEIHTHLMVPSGAQQNFIEVERDWSDLNDKMEHALTHLDKTAAIAERSRTVFKQKFLTPAAINCYWQQLFHGWAKIQAYTPALYDKDEATGQLSLRGTSFEDFITKFPTLPEASR